MTTASVFQMSDTFDMVDGVFVGPAWTDESCRELLRALRKVRAVAPDNPDAAECATDVWVVARVFHEVLTLHPASTRWPIFAGSKPRSSLFKAAITHAYDPGDLSALARLSNDSALAAANVARWLMRLPRQTSATVVFTQPPGVGLPSQRTRSRYATAREIAVAC